jgi:hypothetical protein
MIEPIQCRAARDVLGWTVGDLSAVARGWGAATIIRFERGQATANKAIVAAIERALRFAGVDFINNGEPGARLVQRISTPIGRGAPAVGERRRKRPPLG